MQRIERQNPTGRFSQRPDSSDQTREPRGLPPSGGLSAANSGYRPALPASGGQSGVQGYYPCQGDALDPFRVPEVQLLRLSPRENYRPSL